MSSLNKLNNELTYDKYIEVSLDSSYYMICLKRCINDYSTPLNG